MKKPVTCFYANFCKYIFRFYFNQHTPNASSPIPYHGNVCVQNRGGLLYDTFILPTSCQRWPAHHLNQALVLQPCVQLESRSYQFQVKYAQQDISAAYLDISRCDSCSTSIYKHFNAHCSCERLHYPLLYIARSFPKSVSLFNDKNSSNDGAAQNSTLSQGFKNFYVLRRHVAERWSLAG